VPEKSYFFLILCIFILGEEKDLNHLSKRKIASMMPEMDIVVY